VCPNGDVLAAWYTTVSESGRELAQGGSRLRAAGDRWDDGSIMAFLRGPDPMPRLITHDLGKSWEVGKTWPHVRHVPGVRAYLSVAVAPNGVIYLLGTEIHDQMGCVALNEAWVRQRGPR